MPSPSDPVASIHGCARLCVNPAFPAVTYAPSRTAAHTQTALLPPYPRAAEPCLTNRTGPNAVARGGGVAFLGQTGCTTLARLEEPRDLVHLMPDRTGEPTACHDVVQHTQRSPPHLDFFYVVDAGSTFHRVDLEPGMDGSRHAAFKAHVDTVWRLPPVAGDDRPRQEAQELAVFARDHTVRRIGKLRDPYDLGVGLTYLRTWA